jgi:hypothetical protein
LRFAVKVEQLIVLFRPGTRKVENHAISRQSSRQNDRSRRATTAKDRLKRLDCLFPHGFQTFQTFLRGLCVIDCVSIAFDSALPQATEWQRV